MRLRPDEEKMLSGGDGEAKRRAMEILVKMGDYSGAERMVPVSWADLSTFSGIGGRTRRQSGQRHVQVHTGVR